MTTGFSLGEIQKWMQAALIEPGSTSPAETGQVLTSHPRLPAEQALAIYQRSYALRIAACMRDQFPALCHALGEDLFNDFVAEYVRAAPPESYTLYDLGRRFPGFLDSNRPDADAEVSEVWIDFMVDLARFERQVFVTFDCPGAEGMQLATPDTPDSHLRAQPSLSVGHYRFPVARYFHDIREGKTPDLPPVGPSCVALARKDYLTTTMPISPPHFVFLRAMCQGAGVEAGLQAVAEHYGYEVKDVAASWAAAGDTRASWIRAGFFLDAGADAG